MKSLFSLLTLCALGACSPGSTTSVTSGGGVNGQLNSSPGVTLNYHVDQTAIDHHSLLALTQDLSQLTGLTLPDTMARADFEHLLEQLDYLKAPQSAAIQAVSVHPQGQRTQLEYAYASGATEWLEATPDLGLLHWTEHTEPVQMARTRTGLWLISIQGQELVWHPQDHQLCLAGLCVPTR